MEKELKLRFERAIPVLNEIQSHYDRKTQLQTAAEYTDAQRISDLESSKGMRVKIAVLPGFFIGLLLMKAVMGITHAAVVIAAAYFAALIGFPYAVYRLLTALQEKRSHAVKSDGTPANKYDKKIAELKDGIAAEEKSMLDIYIKNKQLIESFPPDYRYSYAVNKLYRIMLNGRADTMKEAVNVFENDEHNIRMEQGQAQKLAGQRALAAQLSQISTELYNMRTTQDLVVRNDVFNNNI